MIRPGQAIALCVLALLCIGVVMVNSADMAVSAVTSTPLEAGVMADASGQSVALIKPDAVSFTSVIGSRTTIYLILASLALGVGYLFPVRTLAWRLNRPLDPSRGINDRGALVKLGILCMLMVGVTLLAYAPVIGKEINGAHRWLRLPIPGLGDALSAQPSEIVKWCFVLVMAWYGATRAPFITQFWRGLVVGLIAIGVVAGMVVLEDLGTGFLIAASACIIMLAAGARLWQFLLFVPVGIAGIVGAIITNPYRINRIQSFIDPYSDPEGKGYHMIQSMLAVMGGEGTGRGLGHGLQKFGYLPEDRTDFLFAVICEELGIAGAAVVIFLFVGLVWAGVSVAQREKDMFLKLTALGLIVTIAIQALINLAVVTGLGPTKGIALPLVSSGGTGWILTAFSMGILAAIDRTQPEEALVEGPTEPTVTA
ncbi:MAG TPA: FtsW/RodA/SpoVE family cell cycle protein [Phycisphaerales bacterium]|nr:FtsW/RodA/SpoVE family cell cycle protein [Phycisphaerales bacterium]